MRCDAHFHWISPFDSVHPWPVGKWDKESVMFMFPCWSLLSHISFQQNMNLLNTVQPVAQVSLVKFCLALQEVVKYGLGLCVACCCPFPFPENYDNAQTVLVKNDLHVFVIHRIQWGLMWELQLNDGNFYSNSNESKYCDFHVGWADLVPGLVEEVCDHLTKALISASY